MGQIQAYSTPKHIHRYRSMKGKGVVEREIDAITGGYVFCASFSEMNDPMEGLLSTSDMFPERRNGLSAEPSAISDYIAKLGVASFAETFDHEPMWAHYAGQFDGICICYNFMRLLDSITDGVFVRMNYSEQAPIIHRPNVEFQRWRGSHFPRRTIDG